MLKFLGILTKNITNIYFSNMKLISNKTPIELRNNSLTQPFYLCLCVLLVHKILDTIL